jgi:menaquinone-dependent protoporphyrinogen oxidase
MRVLVTYASQSGATVGIAERIAARLQADGIAADCHPVTARLDLAAYDAYVIGSAVYIGRWQKAARAFVEANAAELKNRPTWLFSSGPLGSEPVQAGAADSREGAVSADELARLRDAIHPRDHHVFYGALDPEHLRVGARLMRLVPAGRRLLQEGDFRDWPEIEAWADRIVGELRNAPVDAGAVS